MTSLKGIILGCITFLITVGVFVSYFAAYGRYNLIPQGKGLFIFDRKTATLNYCDSQTCQMIQPVFPLAQNEAVLATANGIPSQNTVISGTVSVSPSVMVPSQGAMTSQETLSSQRVAHQPWQKFIPANKQNIKKGNSSRLSIKDNRNPQTFEDDHEEEEPMDVGYFSNEVSNEEDQRSDR